MDAAGLSRGGTWDTGDTWDIAARQDTTGRLHRDMDRREELGPRQKSALDGLVHALRKDSMDASYPERVLLAYDLGTCTRAPTAVVAVGEPDSATHLTWQVSGMGILVHTAMWGAAHEAAQLWEAQHRAGVERPCVVAWLGHHPPGPWGTLSDRAALQGGARLALHLHGWFDHLEWRQPGEATPHTALEAHSYGTLVAARGLQILSRARPPRSVDTLVVSGALGLPKDLAGSPEKIGLARDQLFVALADTDWLSRAGRRLARRRRWTGFTPIPVLADAALGLAGTVGHNTSQYLPRGDPRRRRYGYRDAGSASLYRIARATAGLPLD